MTAVRQEATARRLTLRIRADDRRTRDLWFLAVIVLTWVYAIGVPTVQSFTASKYRTDILTASVPLSGLALRLQTYSQLGLFGVAALIIVLSLGNLPRSRFLVLAAALAPWFYIVVRDRYLFVPERLNFGIYPAVVISIWCLRPRIARLEWLGYLVGATAVLSLVMGQLLPAKGIYQAASGTEISVDKEIFSSGLLVGPLSNGNNLAQFLAIGLASVLLVRRWWWRWTFVVAVTVAALWASSRSCLIAIGLVAVMVFLQRGLPKQWRGWLTVLALVPLTAVLVIVPVTTTDPLAFTNRGAVWENLARYWHQDRWLGLGTDFFSRIADTSENLGGSVFHGHNQFVQAVVTGGYLYAMLLGLLVLVAIAAAARLARAGIEFGSTFLVALLAASLLEVSFVVIDRFFVLPVMVVPLACLLFTTEDTDLPEPHDDEDPEIDSSVATGRVDGVWLRSQGSDVGSGVRTSRRPAAPDRVDREVTR